MRNIDDLLLKNKSKMLAPILIGIISKNMEGIFKGLEKLSWLSMKKDEKTWRNVFLEITFFYLHWIDRMADINLGNKQRELFIDILFSETGKILAIFFDSLFPKTSKILSKTVEEKQTMEQCYKDFITTLSIRQLIHFSIWKEMRDHCFVIGIFATSKSLILWKRSMTSLI